MNTPLRLLLVEDSEDDSVLLIRALQRAGYPISSHRVETRDGLRQALQDGRWDVILSDYCMPDFDAPAAIQTLKESQCDIPLIVVSGTVGEDVAVETLKLGADDYLLKDNLTRLVPAVERALQMAESRRQRRSFEHMKTLFMENLLDMICTINAEGHFIEVSEASYEILGFRPAELTGRAFMDFVHPKDHAFTQAEAAAIMKGRHTKDFENRYVHRSGKTVHLMWSAAWSESDRLMIAVARDITERKESQQALASALEHLRLAVKAGRAGTWDHDLASGEVTWDEQMLAIYGKTTADVEPGVERWHEAIHPDDITKAKAVYETGLRPGSDSFELEFRISRRTDKAERVIRAIGSIIRDETGQPVRMSGINWDVTEERIREQKLTAALIHEKELAEKARAGDQAKSEFLAVMSHEVRTPLNGILGFAELLSQVPTLTPEYQGYARTIVQSGESLLRILDDILDFSRLEAGRVEIETAPFLPRELLEDIRCLLARQAAEKDLQLLVFVAPSTPEYLLGDAGRLRQILLNLAGNAIKFTEQGSILISLEPVVDSKNILVFSVKDTGSGIATEQLDRIFQPFIQVDSSISRRHGGTGLGLAISRRLTELLGGALSVQSRPGQGSEFFVTVPFSTLEKPSTRPVESEIPLDATFASRHPLRILLVEDDTVNLKLIQTLIRRLGYDPLTAANGREAVDTYLKNHPDCLLMDLQMPEMDGIEATRRIRESDRGTGTTPPFISAITANIFPADRQRCFDVGMNDYLNKPVKMANLAQVLLRASTSRTES